MRGSWEAATGRGLFPRPGVGGMHAKGRVKVGVRDVFGCKAVAWVEEWNCFALSKLWQAVSPLETTMHRTQAIPRVEPHRPSAPPETTQCKPSSS